MAHEIEDGWYALPKGGRVQVLGGVPIRISDGGRLRRLSLEELPLAKLYLLDEAARVTGICLSHCSLAWAGTSTTAVAALLEIVPGA